MIKTRVAYCVGEGIVPINKTKKGKEYRCFGCDGVLIPKLGDINTHHYAHKNNDKCSSESLLHKLSKEIIKQEKSIGGKVYSTCELEKSMGSIRIDCVLDDELYVEIAVTSFIGENKRREIYKNMIHVVEIDVSDLKDKENLSYEEVKNYIFNYATKTHFCTGEYQERVNRELKIHKETMKKYRDLGVKGHGESRDAIYEALQFFKEYYLKRGQTKKYSSVVKYEEIWAENNKTCISCRVDIDQGKYCSSCLEKKYIKYSQTKQEGIVKRQEANGIHLCNLCGDYKFNDNLNECSKCAKRKNPLGSGYYTFIDSNSELRPESFDRSICYCKECYCRKRSRNNECDKCISKLGYYTKGKKLTIYRGNYIVDALEEQDLYKINQEKIDCLLELYS